MTKPKALILTGYGINCDHETKFAFESAGGFDRRFFMYSEDTDLCLRFAQRGWKVFFLPDAKVVHLWAGSWKHDRWLRYYHHHRSIARYFRKYFPKNQIRLALLEFLLIVGLGIRIMLFLVWRRS